jgi:hypothetical protein
MKKLAIPLLVVALISACATQAPQRSAESKSAITSAKNIEIFYTENEKYAVVDAGGSGASGLGGAFGLLGALVSIAADAASKLNAADRAEQRTNQFNSAIVASGLSSNLSGDLASQVANELRAIGKTVKTTAIKRPSGPAVLSASDLSSLNITLDYNPLVLRTTYGYAAESATASYKPLAIVEYALLNANRKVLLENTLKDVGNGESYLTFDGLSQNTAKAGLVVRNNTLASAKKLVNEIAAAGQ